MNQKIDLGMNTLQVYMTIVITVLNIIRISASMKNELRNR